MAAEANSSIFHWYIHGFRSLNLVFFMDVGCRLDGKYGSFLPPLMKTSRQAPYDKRTHSHDSKTMPTSDFECPGTPSVNLLTDELLSKP